MFTVTITLEAFGADCLWNVVVTWRGGVVAEKAFYQLDDARVFAYTQVMGFNG